MKKRLLTWFALLLSITLVSPTASADTTISTMSIEDDSPTSIEALSTAPNSYEMIKTALLAGEPIGRFDTSELTYLEALDLIRQISDETPEIMYLQRWSVSSNGRIEFTYSVPNSIVHTNQKLLQGEVNNVLSSIIKPGSSDFGKVKAIHDYLALNVAYDYDNYNNDTVPADSYTAFGALINGIAVCDGYTKSAQLLMNELGIENYYVFGYGNGGAHSWNLLKLDNQFYFMDITWDDPVPDKPGRVLYNYFLVTSEHLSKDHSWEEAAWPTATSKKYSYFHDFGKVIEDSDMYYYSSNSDQQKLYRINMDGTNKQNIADVRAPYFALAGNWIYFSNYSNGGYLFKMKKDGSSVTRLNDHHSTDLRVEDNTLYYFDNVTSSEAALAIVDDNPPIVKPIGEVVKPSKMWTITFNKEIDPLSLTEENFFVKTEAGESIPVILGVDPSNWKKVRVHAPNGGYKANQNYILTVRNAFSGEGLPLKEAKTHYFHVR